MASFLKSFFLVKKYATFLKYGKGGGGEASLTFAKLSLFIVHFQKWSKKQSKDPILHDSPGDNDDKMVALMILMMRMVTCSGVMLCDDINAWRGERG